MRLRFATAGLACLVLLAPALAPPAAGKVLPERLARALGTVRVLVVDLKLGGQAGEPDAAKRLRKLSFAVTALPEEQVEPDRLRDVDVIVLPTQWAESPDRLKRFDGRSDQYHGFVLRGGGLLVCQPNPTQHGKCTPGLLPYPITFQNHYDKTDTERVNLDPSHFITDDLPGSAMPFPADPMIAVDPRYTVLARQKKTGWASLAVCRFGKGRVAVQTANESPAAEIPLDEEVLRRMVLWAAGRDAPR